MNIAIVGLGYWGPNLVKNFLQNPEVEGVFCYDKDIKRVSYIKQMFPMVGVISSYEEIVSADYIDAVVIATPVSTHFSLAKRALEQDKNVLCEKPLAASSQEAEELVELSERNGKVLMVDHVAVYTGAVRKLKQIINSGELGNLLYYDAVRISLGLFQHDVNVVWDLASHDLSVIDYLVQTPPTAISAVGVRHFNTLEDIAYITLHFDNSFIAHLHVNWIAPVKVRYVLIGGTKKMIVFDDMQMSEKLKIYDKGVDIETKKGVYRTLVQYRRGDMYSPVVDTREPLVSLVQEFIDSIREDRKPLTDGESGLSVVRLLEAADRSIKEGGRRVELVS